MDNNTHKQFAVCERINRARALVQNLYIDIGGEDLIKISEKLSVIFDRQFALLVKSKNGPEIKVRRRKSKD